MQLYPYQIDYVEAIKQAFKIGNRKVILCLTTGGGKTVIFSDMLSKAALLKSRCLVISDRKSLLKQANDTLVSIGVTPQIIHGNRKVDLSQNCFITMVETLHTRLATTEYQEWLKGIQLIIIDEAHKNAFDKIFPFFSPKAYVIGATATPHREGEETPLSKFYDVLIERIKTSELIQLGKLCTAKSYGISSDLSKAKKKDGSYDDEKVGRIFNDIKLYIGVVAEYRRLSHGKKNICFCSSVESSQKLAAEFAQYGYQVREVYYTMSTEQQEENLLWFKNTPAAILCNVGILTTGYDEPSIEVVTIYRVITSLRLFIQICGRGSRTYRNKTHFTILDFGNNIKDRFGFWQTDREWSLDIQPKRKGAGVQPVKECPGCHALVPTTVSHCSECGHKFAPKKKTPKEVKLELLEVKKNALEVFVSDVEKQYTESQVKAKAWSLSFEKKAYFIIEKKLNIQHALHSVKDINEAVKLCRVTGKNEYLLAHHKKWKNDFNRISCRTN